jgi:hypothetical protein
VKIYRERHMAEGSISAALAEAAQSFDKLPESLRTAVLRSGTSSTVPGPSQRVRTSRDPLNDEGR